jgi:REP element-mobilizing transposase RayT
MHCVFATKERRAWLDSDLQARLWPYLTGIARENRITPIVIGGAADHVHALLSIPSTLSISKSMQLIKGNSSKWIHETFPKLAHFGWQDGYGAFSVSVSGVDATIRYIQNQAEHHRNVTFREEVIGFLGRHGIEYDPAMLE